MIGRRAAPAVLAWLALATAAASERIAVTAAPTGPAGFPRITEVRGDGILVGEKGKVTSYVLEGARLLRRASVLPSGSVRCLNGCHGVVTAGTDFVVVDPHPPIVWTEPRGTSREPVTGNGVGGGGQLEVLLADSPRSGVFARDDLRGTRTLELRAPTGTEAIAVEGVGAAIKVSPRADVLVVTTGTGSDPIGRPVRPRRHVLVRDGERWRLHGEALRGVVVDCVGDDGTAVWRDRGGNRLKNVLTGETYLEDVPVPSGFPPSFGCAAAGGRAVIAQWGGPDSAVWMVNGRFPVHPWTVDVVGGPPHPTATVEARQLEVDPTLARYAFVDENNDLTVVNLETGARNVVAHGVVSMAFLASGALAVVDERGQISAHLPPSLP